MKDKIYESELYGAYTVVSSSGRMMGQTVQHNHKAGVIMSSSDLALQGITRHQAGNYTCIASNVEGDGESNVVELRVMYKPICRPDQKRIYGVARNEAAEILCEVDAYPAPETFKWSFNNTAETFDMPQSGYRVHSAQASTLTYTPVKEMDFGTIMCWADNVVGQQKEPCVFHLIAAGKPDMPYNCTLMNQTSDSLEVDCAEGFDGGQRQWFIMEIFDEQTGLLQANVSSKLPLFAVGGLDAGRLLKILIYAANVKGRSEAVTVQAFTLKAAEKQTGRDGKHNQFELASILSVAIFIGVLTVLICIGVVMYILRLRTGATHNHHHHQHKGKNNNMTRPGNLPIKEKISLPLSQSEDLYDEKNPDVVPYNEDPDYKLKSAAQTPATHHNSRSNDSEVAARMVDDRKTYLTSQDELHYAELSLAVSKHIESTGGGGGGGSGPPAGLLSSGSKQLQSGPPVGVPGAQDPNQKKPPAYNYFDEPTIYAQIDHNYKASTNAAFPPIASPSSTAAVAPASTLYPAKPFLREIVTMRTPLVFTQQESCV
ncbi:Immunoglobulin-like domain [Sergentomyia squamirostris]